MRYHRASRFPALLALCTLVLLAACGRTPQEPPTGTSLDPAVASDEAGTAASRALGPSASPGMAEGFYPLEIGNTWTYHRSLRFEIRSSSEPMPPETFESTVTRTLVGTEMLAGREYTVEEVRYDEGDRIVLNWHLYRQDESGLYAADVASNEPRVTESAAAAASPPVLAVRTMVKPPRAIAATSDPEAFLAAWRRLEEKRNMVVGVRRAASGVGLGAWSPPGGPLPEEITRLRYPLRPGASWTIREDPFFGSTVETMEVLRLPPGRFPAACIRIDNYFRGPNDRFQFWFGRSGELGHQYHVEAEATDETGNVIGMIVADETEMLTDLDLVGPGRF